MVFNQIPLMLYDVASDERKLAKELKMVFVDLHSQLAMMAPYHSRISHPWLMHSLYSNFQTLSLLNLSKPSSLQ